MCTSNNIINNNNNYYYYYSEQEEDEGEIEDDYNYYDVVNNGTGGNNTDVGRRGNIILISLSRLTSPLTTIYISFAQSIPFQPVQWADGGVQLLPQMCLTFDDREK
jgi:hypothetical protein